MSLTEASKENQPNSPVGRQRGATISFKQGQQPKSAPLMAQKYTDTGSPDIKRYLKKRSRNEADSSKRPKKRLKRGPLGKLTNSIKKWGNKDSTIIFGQDLESVMASQRIKGIHLDVPVLVRDCLDYLIPANLEEVGIFRICGTNTVVAKLQKDFDSGKKVELTDKIGCHTVSSLIKLYIRELPHPLIPITFQPSLLATVTMKENLSIKDELQRKDALHQAKISVLYEKLSMLTPSNYSLLKEILGALNQFACHSEKNKMNAGNLSKVWGPNLLWSDNEVDPTKGVDRAKILELEQSHKLVEFMIDNFGPLFQESQAEKEPLPNLDFTQPEQDTKPALPIDVQPQVIPEKQPPLQLIMTTPTSRSAKKPKSKSKWSLRTKLISKKPSLPNVRQIFATTPKKGGGTTTPKSLSKHSRTRSYTYFEPEEISGTEPGLEYIDDSISGTEDSISEKEPRIEWIDTGAESLPRKTPEVSLYYYRLSDSKSTICTRLNKILSGKGIVPAKRREDETEGIDPTEAMKLVKSSTELIVCKNNHLSQISPVTTPDYEIYDLIIDPKTRRLAAPTIVTKDGRMMVGYNKHAWTFLLTTGPKDLKPTTS